MNDTSDQNTETQKISVLDWNRAAKVDAERASSVAALREEADDTRHSVPETSSLSSRAEARRSSNKNGSPLRDKTSREDDDKPRKKSIPMKWKAAVAGGFALVMAFAAVGKSLSDEKKDTKQQPKVEQKETIKPKEKENSLTVTAKTITPHEESRFWTKEEIESYKPHLPIVSDEMTDDKQNKVDKAYHNFIKKAVLIVVKGRIETNEIRKNSPSSPEGFTEVNVSLFKNDLKQYRLCDDFKKELDSIMGEKNYSFSKEFLAFLPFSTNSYASSYEPKRSLALKNADSYKHSLLALEKKGWKASTAEVKKLNDFRNKEVEGKLIDLISAINQNKNSTIDGAGDFRRVFIFSASGDDDFLHYVWGLTSHQEKEILSKNKSEVKNEEQKATSNKDINETMNPKLSQQKKEALLGR